jgi:hypothetical protein
MDIDLTNNKLVMDGSARVIRSVESSPITDFTIACESLGPLKFTSRYTLQMVGRDDVVMDFGYASGRPVLLEHNSATAKVWYRLDDAFTQKVRSMMTSTNTPQTH